MLQVFYFIFQEYNKFSLGGLQKQIPQNSIVPENF